MGNWTLAPALSQLRSEVNAVWPDRSKVSDGTLGDPAHASRISDHNPDGHGVVRALDITAKGIDAPAYAEHIRRLGLAGFRPLQNHGYVIWNRRAAYQTNGWNWVKYNGSNPHDKHCHVSVGRDPDQYGNIGGWRIAGIVNDLGELSVADTEAIMKKLKEHDEAFKWLAELIGPMYQDIHGTDVPSDGDKNPRHMAIMTGVTGIRNELVSGSDKDPNSRLSILRRIYDKNRVPDKTV